MHISRIQIKNFRNFSAMDVAIDGNIVMVGENRVGKSNFIFALRLVLDASLPDSVRLLKMSDIWDGREKGVDYKVEVHIDFTDFDDDNALTALLTDYRLADDHTIARLSYVCRKKADITGSPTCEADHEFNVFGGGDESRYVGYQVRRRICLDLLHALRDAEGDLRSWRSSPLRPLLEDAISFVTDDELAAVANDVSVATERMVGLDPIRKLDESLRDQLAKMAGTSQDIKARLGFAPTDPVRMFQSIQVFIDEGRRSLSEASLGSANLALLTLKLAEFAWRREKNERNFTIVAVEEPEAHLHPHLQRSVFSKLFDTSSEKERCLFLTTHSPILASVAPLRSIVLLKDEPSQGTKAYSLAHLDLQPEELDDLQRYLDVSRAEIFFSRGVIFVEGDAEAALMTVFAKNMGISLDEQGIAVCNVSGVNFSPYVRLACSLSLPFTVITDWDPLDGSKTPLGQDRSIKLLDEMRVTRGQQPLSEQEKATLEVSEPILRATAEKAGIFLNHNTLETQIAKTPELVTPLLEVLIEHSFGALRKKCLAEWKADPTTINERQLMSLIGDISKGRFATRLVAKLQGLQPPDYIKAAIKYMVQHG